jgi:hypothetical protein
MEDTLNSGDTHTHERADADVESPIDTERLATRVFHSTIALVLLVMAASLLLPRLMAG